MMTKRKGRFSAVLVLAVIAAAIVLNLALYGLGSSLGADISENDLYGISDDSREYIASLDKEINIHLVGSAVDERLVKFTEKYAGLSDFIHYDVIDPVQQPSVLTQYEIEGDCAVFESPADNRIQSVAFSDIIEYDLMRYAYYGEYVETAFDADGSFTNAIDAVAEDTMHHIYFTEGHEEAELPRTVAKTFQKKRYSAARLNLLRDESIPEDCECIVIHDPDKDIAADELQKLQEYLAGGGKILLFMGSGHTSEFLNLKQLAKGCGIGITDGITGDHKAYYQHEYLIFPTLNADHELTRMLTERDCLLNRALGLTNEGEKNGYHTETLLSSSDSSFLERPDEKPEELSAVTLAAIAENDASGGVLAVIPASLITEVTIDNYANLCNLDLCMNFFAYGFSDVPKFLIPSVPLGTEHNAVPHSAVYGSIAIAVVPAILLIIGTIRVIRRKRA